MLEKMKKMGEQHQEVKKGTSRAEDTQWNYTPIWDILTLNDITQVLKYTKKIIPSVKDLRK